MKAVIFDFYGVICSEIAPFWLSRHFDSSRAIQVKRDLVGDADVGRLSQRTLFERLSEITQISSTMIEQEWLDLAEIDRRMVHLVEECRENTLVGLLTNSPAPLFYTIESINGIRGIFDAVVISSEIGYIKPARKAYEAVLSTLSVDPHEALMIDDNPVNIAGAESIGMHGILFHGYEQLREELRKQHLVD